MSALSLMCRTAILAITLVALTAGVAHAEPGYAPAKPHAKTAAPSWHHAAPAHTRVQTRFSTARRPRSHESGRAAGLAIRRQLAERQAGRRNVAFHANRSQPDRSQPDRSETATHPETERARPSAHPAPAMELASASPVLLFRSAPRAEPTRREEPAPAAEPATAEKFASPSPRAKPESDASDAETLDAKAPDLDAPDPADPDPSHEQASLQVPLRGMPAPLFGSRESLERQNTRLDAEGLERIENESDLVDRIAHKLLVPLPASSALTVNADLAATHRYCRPWTALFLADLARAHAVQFHRPLEVSSAVRTMEYQKHLMQINGNAAPAEGDIVSPHLTGATVDIAKDGLSRDEIAWMRRRLLALEASDKIDVEEEFRQACFHITVYKDYAPPRPASQPGSESTGPRHHKTADPTTAVAAQGQ